MEPTLRDNLFKLRDAYCGKTGASHSTVAQGACGDWRFFDRIGKGSASFTARTYDKALLWFSTRWPADVSWPEGVERPVVPAPTEGAAA